MIDFQHELSKIQKSLDDKIITEQTASYEITKLRCLAKKLKVEYDLPRQNIIITQNMVNEDYKELCELKNNGLLKDKYFLRDGTKILALCEQYGLQFPGDINSVLINDVARLLSESDEFEDEYEGLEDEDEFGDDGTEPRLVAQKTLSDGTVLEQWSIGSDIEYCINGEILEPEQLIEIVMRNADDFGGLDNLIKGLEYDITLNKTALNKWINSEPENEAEAHQKDRQIAIFTQSIEALELMIDNIKNNGTIDYIILDYFDIDSYF